jgi:hypothetical protein
VPLDSIASKVTEKGVKNTNWKGKGKIEHITQ